MSVELILFVGVQASGKTTFYRRRMQASHIHVSLDNWRGKGNVRGREERAIRAGLAAAAQSGGAVRGVVVDNTNTARQTRARYFEMARAFTASTGCPVRAIAYWFDCPLPECLARNADRPMKSPAGQPYFVPAEVIASFSEMLEPPGRGEGFDEIWRIRPAPQREFLVERM